jgi:hypothetical protein
MQNANANCEKILIEDVWPILSINTNILHFAIIRPTQIFGLLRTN